MYQFSLVTQSCPTLCDPMDCSTPVLPVHHQLPEFTQTYVHWALQASLSITSFQSLPKLMSIESVMPSNHLILCCPLLFSPSIFPSIRVFSNESVLHIRWPKYWSFRFNISPSNEHSGLISFRMDWLDLLTVQGTLKSLLQHHSSKASILRHSAFFIVQFSHPYLTTRKTIASTRWTFVGKVMSQLSRLVITFLLRRKHLFISWLQSPSAVISEPRKLKSDTVSTVSPSICHKMMGLDAMILVFWMLSFKPTFSFCIQISQEAGEVVWYSHLFKNFPQLIVIHTVKDFGIVNKAEIDVFLKLSCFFDDPADVGNLISGSSAFSKISLNIWKFTVHILLKPGLENFEHYFASVWNESNCVVWTCILIWLYIFIIPMQCNLTIISMHQPCNSAILFLGYICKISWTFVKYYMKRTIIVCSNKTTEDLQIWDK